MKSVKKKIKSVFTDDMYQVFAYHGMYFQIARFNNAEAIIHEKEYQEKATKIFTGKLDALEYVHKRSMHVVAAVVFSGLALEAFINDYARRNKLATKAKKMNYMEKWENVPKLVTGKGVPGITIKRIKELKKLRDSLVHFKSFQLPLDGSFKGQIKNYLTLTDADSDASVQTVINAVEALHAIDTAVKKDWLYLPDGVGSIILEYIPNH